MRVVRPIKYMDTPAIQRLEAWMKEVTDLLCYQPEVPTAHKTCVVDAMMAFTKEVERMDGVRQAETQRLRANSELSDR